MHSGNGKHRKLKIHIFQQFQRFYFDDLVNTRNLQIISYQVR